MTPSELAAIRERCEKATKNTLAVDVLDGEYRVHQVVTGFAIADVYGTPYSTAKDNAAFLASANTDIPALLSEVSRLTAERDRLRAVVDKLPETYPWYSSGQAAEAAAAASKAQGDTK